MTWMILKVIMLSGRSQAKKKEYMLYDSIYIKLWKM